jgi:hypothetical protein
MAAADNPMVCPEYINEDSEVREKIELRNNVLVFGSGKLKHESLFFLFDTCESVVLYDPLQTPATSLPRKFLYFPSLDDALAKGPFQAILCLFSLHYEPWWLFTLAKVFKALSPNGTIYFTEDRGFRAIVDGRLEPEDDATSLEKSLHNASRRRRLSPYCSPWPPCLSASSYDVVYQVLSTVARPNKQSIYRLTRQYDAAKEPHCYLPWSDSVIKSHHRSALLKDVLDAATNVSTVTEIIVLTSFTKLRDLPDLIKLDDHQTRAVWNVVCVAAVRSVESVLLHLHHSRRREDTGKEFAEAFLQSSYLNLLRHFQSPIAAEIILGIARFGPHGRESTFIRHDLDPISFTEDDAGGAIRSQLCVRFARPKFYTDYIERVKNDNNYLFPVLAGRGICGLYLWLPDSDSKVVGVSDAVRCFVVDSDEHADLRKEYTDRQVPHCVYALNPGFVSGDEASLTELDEAPIGVCVIYLGTNVSDVPALLYVTPILLQLVFGPAALLEFALAEHEQARYKTILPILNELKEKAADLRDIAKYVENLKDHLDPHAWSVGRAELSELAQFLSSKFPEHSHEPHNKERNEILEIVSSYDYVAKRRAFVDRLKQVIHGSSAQWIGDLFAGCDAGMAADDHFRAAVLLKIISKNRLPVQWLTFAMPTQGSGVPDSTHLDELLLSYFDLREGTSPLEVLRAIVALKHEAPYSELGWRDSRLTVQLNLKEKESGTFPQLKALIARFGNDAVPTASENEENALKRGATTTALEIIKRAGLTVKMIEELPEMGIVKVGIEGAQGMRAGKYARPRKEP